MFQRLFLKRPKLYCDGCGLSMATVRHVWNEKGKDYCCRSCLEVSRLALASGFQ
jgi:hypothetical protein